MANVFICVYLRRTISTSIVNHNMKNFNKFRLIYRGTEMEKKQQRENPDRNVLGWCKNYIFSLNCNSYY